MMTIDCQCDPDEPDIRLRVKGLARQILNKSKDRHQASNIIFGVSFQSIYKWLKRPDIRFSRKILYKLIQSDGFNYLCCHNQVFLAHLYVKRLTDIHHINPDIAELADFSLRCSLLLNDDALVKIVRDDKKNSIFESKK